MGSPSPPARTARLCYPAAVEMLRSVPLRQAESGRNPICMRTRFSVATAPVFSSVKPSSDYTRRRFVGAEEASSRSRRWSSHLPRRPRGLSHQRVLKIGTQDFEEKILTGAGDLLSRFHKVQLGLSLKRYSAGQDN
jgi:hypothetical protein